MQILKVFFFLLLSGVASAQNLSFSLYDVALPDLVRVLIDDVAGASVIVSNDVLEDRRPVSFVLRQTTKEQAIHQLKEVASGRGYELVKVRDVYHLRKNSEVEVEYLVYLPMYRGVSYLTDLLGTVVNRQAVTNNRQLPAIQSQPGQTSAPPSPQAYETGTNVNSLMDKNDKDIMVIKGKPSELAMVKKLLAELDRPIPEMLVKAVVMEVQTGAVEGSAVSFLATLVAKGLPRAAIAFDGGADIKNGVSFKVDGIEAIWTAINSDSRFKVVSAPQIRVKSGAAARFSVGSDTPVLGAVNYQGNGQSVQSVEYKPSGVILELKPEIRGKLAELKVMQQLSSFAKTETGVNGSPTLLKRELSTSVVVGQNDVVLLGGLDEEKTSNDSAGLIFLPEFMRSKYGNKSRSEIILMLYVERVTTPGEVI